MNLKNTFIELVTKYTANTGLTNELWKEIESNYTAKKRFYHNLEHLNHLLEQLTEIKSEIQHWDTILFTLYYHDIIYHALKSDNEEKSAELAAKRLKQMNVPTETIAICKNQILATKSHLACNDSDTNYFTDADLSILGQPWEDYSLYYKNVRKEYSIYPDFIYKPGRRKVLEHFLNMNPILKTPYFYGKLEKQAKENLKKELDMM